MALYLADGIEKGRLDYHVVFSRPVYQPLQVSVGAMLVADGFQDKIVPIV